MKASDLLVDQLVKNWVKVVYWVPGEENLDLIESIRESEEIDLILTRNEQTAVFMAATYGRLTENPWVAISTLGPWATNLVTWVTYAQLGGFPVVVITWQKPIKKSKQGLFQIINVVSMMEPITKFATKVVSGYRLAHILNNAFRLSKSERPGASCIELPEDIARESVDVDTSLISHQKVRRPAIDEKCLNNLIKELEKAKHPIILIWAWANRKKITKYLTYFIQKHNIPFFTSQMWKGVVDESLSQCLGTAALSSGDYIHDAISQSDLILSVWYDPVEKPTYLIGSWGVKTIHINFFESRIDPVYSPYLDIVGDIGNTFWQLCESNIDTTKQDFERIYSTKEKYQEQITRNIEEEDMGDNIMGPRKLVNDTRNFLEKEDILALDNWLYKVWFARNYICYKPNTLILDNALATMGAGVASGMEAKRLNPNKNVVVITGDGWFMMNVGDLETAVRQDLDLIIVVLNDWSYWMIKWKQQVTSMPVWWMDFGNPDYVKLAESFGWVWFRVENKNNFFETLKNAQKQKWLKIIDLKFKYPEEIN